jgi:hypothetical protein
LLRRSTLEKATLKYWRIRSISFYWWELLEMPSSLLSLAGFNKSFQNDGQEIFRKLEMGVLLCSTKGIPLLRETLIKFLLWFFRRNAHTTSI